LNGKGTKVKIPSRQNAQNANHPRFPALEREHQFVRALDFVFGLQKFFTPWFARALGARVDGVANREAVIAGSPRAVARKLLTSLAGFEKA
jgi:hypothetical protein